MLLLTGVFLLAAGLSGLRTRRRPPGVTVGELGGASPGRRVMLVGAAAPGPDGAVRSPVTGAPCVWWQVSSSEWENGDTRLSDRTYARSEALLAVRDDTGRLVFAPDPATGVHGLPQSSHEDAVPDRPGVVLERSEIIMPEGTEIRVTGTLSTHRWCAGWVRGPRGWSGEVVVEPQVVGAVRGHGDAAGAGDAGQGAGAAGGDDGEELGRAIAAGGRRGVHEVEGALTAVQ